ncbi:YcaO-like family protein [Paenibacillus sp. P26]|nr:YcaO-like family protein [Paenibacillus sp. P26]
MGYTLAEANNTAVAEAVERYCAAYDLPEGTVAGSWKELGEEALHPDEPPLFTPEQYGTWNFPYTLFEESTRLRWVKGRSLTTGREKWVPARFGLGLLPAYGGGEAQICFGFMTGSACGATMDQAVLSGSLEIIERDAFMIMWYNRLSLPRLDLASCPRLAERFRVYTEQSRFQLHLVNTTSDLGVPSVFGVLKTRDGKVCIGGAARLTQEEAVKKTLFEISQLFMGNKHVLYQASPKSMSAVGCYGVRDAPGLLCATLRFRGAGIHLCLPYAGTDRLGAGTAG